MGAIVGRPLPRLHLAAGQGVGSPCLQASDYLCKNLGGRFEYRRPEAQLESRDRGRQSAPEREQGLLLAFESGVEQMRAGIGFK